MKKIVAVMFALALTLFMAGCEKTFSGRPSDVVKECQRLTADETAEATVKGYIISPGTVGVNEDGYSTFTLGDNISLVLKGQETSVVYVVVKDPSVSVQALRNGDAVTARGYVEDVTPNSIVLNDAAASKTK